MIKNIDTLVKTITHGVYVIGVKDQNRENAFTAAWVMQVSFDPLLLCISINPEHYSWQILQQGKICSVNVLQKSQLHYAEHFGSSGLKDKMAGFSWQRAQTGAPILSEALSYFDCRLRNFYDAGDHKLVVCEVLDAALLNAGKPLLYIETGNMDNSEMLFGERD
jgi:flavin reductase (DIM6/NTAB) family NADH-FMN oxidoreductase RutF